ncbi:LuxR C-terminal-related transcriptional regulator [Nocardioides sp. LHD-245]|uniref:response regulator transcription factor n=1 Tax=Nocardioides sp. LHD-245 TaxID=3051387 RepID=UPI0027E0147F|nr:LuxR C-terminal-related transcriptional regulator [Nocardioides sp. LHD-245]
MHHGAAAAKAAGDGGNRRPARITIIDGHLLFADSLALALESEGFIVTVIDPGEPQASLATVLAAALRSAGRLVLLEHRLGLLGDGLRLVTLLTASGATVVLLTESTAQARWGAAVHQGAKDVLHKTCSLEELVGTARRVRDGLPLMSRQQRAALIEAAFADRDEVQAIRARLDRLTRREMQVLGALMSGDLVPEIARSNVVAVATVRTQVKSILYKLESTSQLAAVGAAHRVDWRPPVPPTRALTA